MHIHTIATQTGPQKVLLSKMACIQNCLSYCKTVHYAITCTLHAFFMWNRLIFLPLLLSYSEEKEVEEELKSARQWSKLDHLEPLGGKSSNCIECSGLRRVKYIRTRRLSMFSPPPWRVRESITTQSAAFKLAWKYSLLSNKSLFVTVF